MKGKILLEACVQSVEDVWQYDLGNEGWGHAEVEENWGEYDAAYVWRLSKEASVKWGSEGKTGVIDCVSDLVRRSRLRWLMVMLKKERRPTMGKEMHGF